MRNQLEAPLLNYPDFGKSPKIRMRVLCALSSLMGRSLGLYTAESLDLVAEEWRALRSWLLNAEVAGEALLFWRADPHGVRVLRVCNGHVLVGTAQMLQDLSKFSLAVKSPFSESDETSENPNAPVQTTHVPSMDELWQSARRYVVAEVSELS